MEYLKAVRKIFECGLLSHDKVTDGDALPLLSISEGLQYFEEWCDEAISHGNVCVHECFHLMLPLSIIYDVGVDVKADAQTVFLAWQVCSII